MDYRIEEALRRAKELPPRYFAMGGVVVLLLVVGLFVWWPDSAPKPTAETEAALAKLKADQEANAVPPPPAPSAEPLTPRRQAIKAK